MKIYVAASWRTEAQPIVVTRLREHGYKVYDFRDHGFSWREVDPRWATWTVFEYRRMLAHPVAVAGFQRDRAALDGCDVLVLLLPSGRSAHLEAGYAAGQGKPVLVVVTEKMGEPELMYGLGREVCVGLGEMLDALNRLKGSV